jgi:hypothetical protein
MRLSQIFYELFENVTKQHPIPFSTNNLPMDYTSRMHRAKSLGFDIKTIYYHGTVHDFKSFDPRLSNSSSNTGTPLGALVLSSNPNISNTYAGQETTSWGDISGYKSGGKLLPLLLKNGKTMTIDAKGRNWNDLYLPKYPELETTNDLAEDAQSKIKDILIINNVIDVASYVPKEKRSGNKATTVFVFKPSLVRSVNAIFDPANIDQEDLLA